VGNSTHIGTGVNVIQGIVIGKGVLIGAGALVLKNAPDHVVLVGIPARETK